MTPFDQNPGIAIIKSGTFQDENGDGLSPGRGSVSPSATFTVTNTGDVTLTNITVTDPLVTVSGGPITLAPGASDSTTFTATYTLLAVNIDRAVSNQAAATADPDE